MIIAIDLDGVVFDTENYYRTYSQLYDLKFVRHGLLDGSEMHVFKRYGWDKEAANDFYDKYTDMVLTKATIKPAAKYVIDELKKLGHTLICITLRGKYRHSEIEITEKRLQESEIVFDKIIYNQENKLNACKEEGVELIIEDNPSNVEFLAENDIKCFHFKDAGIKKVEHKNVITVQNWADVLEKVINFDKVFEN